jgi:hypothetical protein
MLRERL